MVSSVEQRHAQSVQTDPRNVERKGLLSYRSTMYHDYGPYHEYAILETILSRLTQDPFFDVFAPKEWFGMGYGPREDRPDLNWNWARALPGWQGRNGGDGGGWANGPHS